MDEIPGVVNPWRSSVAGEQSSNLLAAIVGTYAEQETDTRINWSGEIISRLEGPSLPSPLHRQTGSDLPAGEHYVRSLRMVALPQRLESSNEPEYPDRPHDHIASRFGRKDVNGELRRVAIAGGVAGGTFVIGLLFLVLAVSRVPLRPNPYIALALTLGGAVLIGSAAVALRDRHH
jgi:hypothetical protein